MAARESVRLKTKFLKTVLHRTVLAGEARAPCLSLPYPTRESRFQVGARSSRSFVAGHPTPTRCAPSLPCAASERSPKQRAFVRLLAPPRRARPAPSHRFALVRSSRTSDCREAFAVVARASRFAPACHRCAGRMAPRAAHRGLVARSAFKRVLRCCLDLDRSIRRLAASKFG
jgi:hypothetical protein